MRDPHGKIIQWYGLATDIDERKRAEAQLAGEKQLLEMIISGCSLHDVLVALCRFVEEAAPTATAASTRLTGVGQHSSTA